MKSLCRSEIRQRAASSKCKSGNLDLAQKNPTKVGFSVVGSGCAKASWQSLANFSLLRDVRPRDIGQPEFPWRLVAIAMLWL